VLELAVLSTDDRPLRLSPLICGVVTDRPCAETPLGRPEARKRGEVWLEGPGPGSAETLGRGEVRGDERALSARDEADAERVRCSKKSTAAVTLGERLYPVDEMPVACAWGERGMVVRLG